jgi:hypothetical protein
MPTIRTDHLLLAALTALLLFLMWEQATAIRTASLAATAAGS